MKHRNVVSGLVMCLAALWLMAACSEGVAREKGDRKKREPKEAKPATVVGVVAVEKEDDEIKGVTLTAKRKDQEVVVNVELDEKGKQLGEEMDGKKAMVKGTIKTKDGAKWITVQEFKEPKARKKKEK
jgi:flagellar basal body-associated protein FliL